MYLLISDYKYNETSHRHNIDLMRSIGIHRGVIIIIIICEILVLNSVIIFRTTREMEGKEKQNIMTKDKENEQMLDSTQCVKMIIKLSRDDGRYGA